METKLSSSFLFRFVSTLTSVICIAATLHFIALTVLYLLPVRPSSPFAGFVLLASAFDFVPLVSSYQKSFIFLQQS